MTGTEVTGTQVPDELVARALRLLAHRPRVLLGITGPPGAGKSTLAESLLRRLLADSVPAALVGMDGFHLAHEALRRMGRLATKGAPDTFDAAGYVALLRRLRSPGADTVWAPRFRREIEDPVASAVPVGPDVRLVLTEGNYLLCDGPWRPVRELLDQTWYLNLSDGPRRHRLAARHQRFGRGKTEAWERTLGSDENNADIVRGTRVHADVLVEGDGASVRLPSDAAR